MKTIVGFALILAMSSYLTAGCVGAVPGKTAKRIVSASDVSSADGGFGDAGFENDTLGADRSVIDPNAAVAVDPSVGGAGPLGEAPLPGDGGAAAGPALRWIAMGDFGELGLADFSECTTQTNVQRSPCAVKNEKCISSFATSCSSPEGCRRLFKCTTGQNNTLAWFPMGDGATLSDAQAASPAYGICSVNADIAGSECTSVNSRCLSSFCTSGSGSACGRRVFKCLTTGVAGRYFYRWMGDKPEAELAGIGECALQTNIAGSECFAENSTCKSSFVSGSGSRRLFKCTP